MVDQGDKRGERELLGDGGERGGGPGKRGERATRGMEGREEDQVRGVRELLGGWRGERRTR